LYELIWENVGSMPISIDLVGDLIGKEELDWYDDEKYEPESDL
jgi:hypothetical protein